MLRLQVDLHQYFTLRWKKVFAGLAFGLFGGYPFANFSEILFHLRKRLRFLLEFVLDEHLFDIAFPQEALEMLVGLCSQQHSTSFHFGERSLYCLRVGLYGLRRLSLDPCSFSLQNVCPLPCTSSFLFDYAFTHWLILGLVIPAPKRRQLGSFSSPLPQLHQLSVENIVFLIGLSIFGVGSLTRRFCVVVELNHIEVVLWIFHFRGFFDR